MGRLGKIAVILCAMLVGATSPGLAAEPIKIGAILRLSTGAPQGLPAKRGVQLAVDEFNQAGGLDGRKVVVIFEDEKNSPSEALKAAKKLCEVDKVTALVGPMSCTATLEAYKTADEAKVVIITPTAISPQVSGASPYLFRGCSHLNTQAKAMIAYLTKTAKPKSVAIFYWNSTCGKGTADIFAKFFKEAGIKEVARESFNQGERDFTAHLSRIKAANPDILFICGYTSATASAAAQARQLGLNQRLVGARGDINPQYVKLAGKAAAGHLAPGDYLEDYDTPKNKKFRKNYYKQAKEANEPVNIMLAALAYDSTGLVLAGIKKNGPTSEGIKKFLNEVKEFDGVTGKLSFDKNNDAVRSNTASGVYLFEIKDGKYVQVK
ncbi:MAG: ABC transporter substrate-binding protein [Desulfobaccales bacterium]